MLLLIGKTGFETTYNSPHNEKMTECTFLVKCWWYFRCAG